MQLFTQLISTDQVDLVGGAATVVVENLSSVNPVFLSNVNGFIIEVANPGGPFNGNCVVLKPGDRTPALELASGDTLYALSLNDGVGGAGGGAVVQVYQS
jgi:hypothetical protein